MDIKSTSAFAVLILLAGLGLLMISTGITPDSETNTTGEKEGLAMDITGSEEDSEQKYINKYDSAGELRNWTPKDGEFPLGEPGTYEVTHYPNTEPTAEHINSSWRLYNRTYEAAKRNGWFNYENAVEEDYIDYVLTDGRHHYNTSYYLDGEALNPEKPESLIYYEDPENKSNQILAGVMYQNIKKEGRQIGGPLTIWHYHPITSWKLERLNEVIRRETKYKSYRQILNDSYENVPEDRSDRTGMMIHVWFVEHPRGPFGTGMSVPSDSLENPTKMSKDEFEARMMKNIDAQNKDK